MKKIFLLRNFYESGNILLLYEGREEKCHIFNRFMEKGLRGSEFCVYIYPDESEKLSFRHNSGEYLAQLRSFPISDRKVKFVKRDDIERVKSRVEELHNSRLGIDFGSILTKWNMSAIFDLEEIAHRKSISTLSAFDATSLNQEIVSELIKLHEKAIISGRDGTSISFSKPASVDAISAQSMEQCIKNSLDAIIFSMLSRGEMCGFDAIKSIFQNFRVLLSQGTVYPVFYSLKKQGYVETRVKPDNKTVVYALSEAGKKFAQHKIREYIAAQEKVLHLISAKKKVMVVDDDEGVIEAVRQILAPEGFETITAVSGEECLGKLQAVKPDCIILDISMPEMDGWEVLRRIKADEGLREIPIVMLTAKKLAESLGRDEMKNVADYVAKPFTKEDIIQTIKMQAQVG